MSDTYGYCDACRARITLDFCRRYRARTEAATTISPAFNDKCRNCDGLKMSEETKTEKGENQIMSITETEAPAAEAVKVARKPSRKPRRVTDPVQLKARKLLPRKVLAKTRRPVKPRPEDMNGAGDLLNRVGAEKGGRGGRRTASAPVSIDAAIDLLGQALDCLRLILGGPRARKD